MHKKEYAPKFICPVCQNNRNSNDMFSGQTIRPAVIKFIKKYDPDWSEGDSICSSCLNKARSDLVEEYLLDARGELSESEKEVLESIRSEDILTTKPSTLEATVGFGEKFSDKLAEVGGSWRFIICFAIILSIWVILNSYALFFKPFDPYPFILLNLFLSCLAAIQAPVIMMSQNRKESKDRIRAEADYKTNLKAELEIRHLHMKVDELTKNQWQKLLEIQQVQLDVLKDYVSETKKN